MKVSDIILPKEVDIVEPVEVDSAPSLVSVLENNAERSVSERQFSGKIYGTVDKVAEHDQSTGVPYSSREVQEEHKRKLRVSNQLG